MSYNLIPANETINSFVLHDSLESVIKKKTDFVGDHTFHQTSLIEIYNMIDTMEKLPAIESDPEKEALYDRFKELLINTADTSVGEDLSRAKTLAKNVKEAYIGSPAEHHYSLLNTLVDYLYNMHTVIDGVHKLYKYLSTVGTIQEDDITEVIDSYINPLYQPLDDCINMFNYKEIILDPNADPTTFQPVYDFPLRFKIFRIIQETVAYQKLSTTVTDYKSRKDAINDCIAYVTLFRDELNKLNFMNKNNHDHVIKTLDDFRSLLYTLLSLILADDIEYVADIDKESPVDLSGVQNAYEDINKNLDKVTEDMATQDPEMAEGIMNITAGMCNRSLDLIPSFSVDENNSNVTEITLQSKESREEMQSNIDRIVSNLADSLRISDIREYGNKAHQAVVGMRALRAQWAMKGMQILNSKLSGLYNEIQKGLDKANFKINNPAFEFLNKAIGVINEALSEAINALNSTICALVEVICLIKDAIRAVMEVIDFLVRVFTTSMVLDALKSLGMTLLTMIDYYVSDITTFITENLALGYHGKAPTIASRLEGKLRAEGDPELNAKLDNINMTKLVNEAIDECDTDRNSLADQVTTNLKDMAEGISSGFLALVETLTDFDSCPSPMRGKIKGMNIKMPKLTIQPKLKIGRLKLNLDCGAGLLNL